MMAGQLGLPLTEVMTYTMRQLVVMHDASLLLNWDQTTAVVQQLHSIGQIVTTWGSKRKPKFESWAALHPFRIETRNTGGTFVTPDNIDELQERLLNG